MKFATITILSSALALAACSGGEAEGEADSMMADESAMEAGPSGGDSTSSSATTPEASEPSQEADTTADAEASEDEGGFSLTIGNGDASATISEDGVDAKVNTDKMPGQGNPNRDKPGRGN